LFDPTDGTLSLRRCTLELRPKERSAIGMGGALSGTSISLPGMGGAGKLSASPSSKGSGGGSAWKSGAGRSGLTEMMDGGMEMVGRESVVATWSLGMRGEEGEVRKALVRSDEGQERELAGRAECVHFCVFSRCLTYSFV